MQALVDRTEQIKWWDALDKLEKLEEGMLDSDLEAWLRCVRDCLHPDARWLASLFPDEPVTMTKQAMLSVMKAREDRRALFMRFCVDAGDRDSLRQAAELGYAPAQFRWSKRSHASDVERFGWAEKAAAQGDRQGLFRLGYWLCKGRGCEMDRARGFSLWKDAAELEQRNAHWYLGIRAYSASDWQRYRWWGRGAARGDRDSILSLRTSALTQLKLFDEGKGSGRVVLELGSVCNGHVDIASGKLFGMQFPPRQSVEGAQRCVELHEKWCIAAKAAIECWILVARRLLMVKDIRQIIARLSWAQRADWSKVKSNESC